MLLAAAVLAAAVALPAQTPTPTPAPVPTTTAPVPVLPAPGPIVKIPDTNIDVCLVADLDSLGEIKASAQAALTKAGLTFPALRALCTGDDTPTGTATATATATAGPTATSGPTFTPRPTFPGSAIPIPVGAPETGDGSTVGDSTPTGHTLGLIAMLAGLIGAGTAAASRRVPGSRV